jgi:hypothetical protein
VLQHVLGDEEDVVLEQRAGHLAALAGAFAVEEGGEDREGGVQAPDRVADREAGAQRMQALDDSGR